MNDRKMQQIERDQIAAEAEAPVSDNASDAEETHQEAAIPDLVDDKLGSRDDRQSWYMLKQKRRRSSQGK